MQVDKLTAVHTLYKALGHTDYIRVRLVRILHEGNEVTTGILPFALWASKAVQIRSGRICQGKYAKHCWLPDFS